MDISKTPAPTNPWAEISHEELLTHLLTCDGRGKIAKAEILEELINRGATAAARDLASNGDHIPLIKRIIIRSFKNQPNSTCP